MIPIVNADSASSDLKQFWEGFLSWKLAISASEILKDHGFQMSSCPQAKALMWIGHELSWNVWQLSRLHKRILSLNNENLTMLAQDPYCDLNETDAFGRTAVHLATYVQNASAVDILVSLGADLNIRDSTGKMPLHIAVSLESSALIKKILLARADINARDQLGNTPLAHACCQGLFDIVEVLLDAGADIDAANLVGETPLRYAIFGDHLDVVKLLHERGASFLTKDVWGSTTLHLAVRFNSYRVLHYLLDNIKMRTDEKYKSGKTIFHIVAESAHEETILTFFSKCTPAVDIRLKDKDGWTALDYIERKHNGDQTKHMLTEIFSHLENNTWPTDRPLGGDRSLESMTIHSSDIFYDALETQ